MRPSLSEPPDKSAHQQLGTYPEAVDAQQSNQRRHKVHKSKPRRPSVSRKKRKCTNPATAAFTQHQRIPRPTSKEKKKPPIRTTVQVCPIPTDSEDELSSSNECDEYNRAQKASQQMGSDTHSGNVFEPVIEDHNKAITNKQRKMRYKWIDGETGKGFHTLTLHRLIFLIQ